MASDGDDGEVKIVKEENLDPVLRHNLWRSRLSFKISALVVGVYFLLGLVPIIIAVATNKQPPSWALTIEASTVTAAVAFVFKDHFPTTSSKSEH